MHKTDVNTGNSKTQTGDAKALAPFEPFTWLRGIKTTNEANLLALAKDVAGGVQLSLQMVERAEIDSTGSAGPYLSVADRSVLLRFAVTACGMLNDRIDGLLDDLRDEARK